MDKNYNKMKKLTEEEIIEQRKQFPRVKIIGFNFERILIQQNIDGSCICVDKEDEYKFLQGCKFKTSTWCSFETLSSKKQVPFEHGKEIDWDWKFSLKKSGYFRTVKGLGKDYIEFELCKITLKEAFEHYELSKDNGKTWQFAGKEIEEE